MGLTKSKGNMYPWVTHTWNPIKGKCEFECPYCYVKSPRGSAFDRWYGVPCYLEEKELGTNLGKGRTIFVGSMSDMWGPWVKINWIHAVLIHCQNFPFNKYVFQTKNPFRYQSVMFHHLHRLYKVVVGTTIETDQYPIGFQSNAPSIENRFHHMATLPRWLQRFVTIEPIMNFRVKTLMDMIRNIRPNFVTIGADSKGHGLVEPPWEKVEKLIAALGEEGIEIRQKTNLERLKK